MELFPALEKAYTKEHKKAGEAQELAYFIAFGPIIFQVGRLMIKFGILDMLRDNEQGLTQAEIAEKTGLSPYAVKVLMEGSLCIGLVLVNTETDRFTLSKTGWFLLTDPAIRVNIDFNHDVNYEGWFHLEEALKEGRPAGLEHFGSWPTIYEGLSQLPPQVQKSWFGFDHYYSDHSFDQALQLLFGDHPKTVLDVGGNTGRWALRCVDYDENVKVTIMDLPDPEHFRQDDTEVLFQTAASSYNRYGSPVHLTLRGMGAQSRTRRMRRSTSLESSARSAASSRMTGRSITRQRNSSWVIATTRMPPVSWRITARSRRPAARSFSRPRAA